MAKIKVIQILEATIGGTRTHLNYLTKYLNKELFELTVICSAKRDESFVHDLKKMETMGIQIYQIDLYRQVHIWKDLISMLQIYKILKNKKYDIVHTHAGKAGLVGRIAAVIAGIKKIYHTPHGFAYNRYTKNIMNLLVTLTEKILSIFTTRLICVSESESKYAISKVKINYRKIIIIPNAVKTTKSLRDTNYTRYTGLQQLKEKMGIYNGSKVVGTVGYFRPQKDYITLIQSINMVLKINKNIQFLFIGDGEGKAEIESLISLYNIENHIIMTGYIPFKKMKSYYLMMDLYLSTSLWEGMSYSILEAMSYGIPVIATDVDGNADIINHTVNGLLVPKKDAQKTAITVLKVLNNCAIRNVLSNNAKVLISDKYLIKDNISKYEQLYQNRYSEI